jgi:1-phosphofructokinase/tagatose 6-phosphate kinase
MTGTPGRLLFVTANPSIDRLYELGGLTVGGIHRPVSTTTVPGGKGLNAARAAAGLGGDVAAVAILGGRSGDWIVDQLAELALDVRAIRVTGETRTCVSILDRSSGALTEVYEPGEPIEPADWEAVEAAIASEVARGDVAAVAISGSLPPGAPSDGFGRITRLANGAAPPVLVMADTYGPALAAVLAERPALVKVNATEATDASGVAVTDVRSAAMAADALRDAGANVVIVTLGVDGAVVVGPNGRFRLVVPPLAGRYPVGSGDAFLGGLAVAVARGEDAVEAARLGCAAGIANAQVPGAGQLDAGQVPAILEAIKVEPI